MSYGPYISVPPTPPMPNNIPTEPPMISQYESSTSGSPIDSRPGKSTFRPQSFDSWGQGVTETGRNDDDFPSTVESTPEQTSPVLPVIDGNNAPDHWAQSEKFYAGVHAGGGIRIAPIILTASLVIAFFSAQNRLPKWAIGVGIAVVLLVYSNQ